jgi:hypothetical protein
MDVLGKVHVPRAALGFDVALVLDQPLGGAKTLGPNAGSIGLGGAAKHAQRAGEMIVIGYDGIVGGNRAGEQIGRLIGSPGMKLDQAEFIERGSVFRRLAQDFQAQPDRGSHLSRTKMRGDSGKFFLKGNHGGRHSTTPGRHLGWRAYRAASAVSLK